MEVDCCVEVGVGESCFWGVCSEECVDVVLGVAGACVVGVEVVEEFEDDVVVVGSKVGGAVVGEHDLCCLVVVYVDEVCV